MVSRRRSPRNGVFVLVGEGLIFWKVARGEIVFDLDRSFAGDSKYGKQKSDEGWSASALTRTPDQFPHWLRLLSNGCGRAEPLAGLLVVSLLEPDGIRCHMDVGREPIRPSAHRAVSKQSIFHLLTTDGKRHRCSAGAGAPPSGIISRPFFGKNFPRHSPNERAQQKY